MKAIILAAGIGSRLQPILRGRPKPLLELDGKSLLEHSLEALSSQGIKSLELALGYGAGIIKKTLSSRIPGLRVNYHFNPSFESTGSMHSLYCALKEPEDCLVLDGDILFDPRILNQLLSYKPQDAVVLEKCVGRGDEVFVKLAKDSRVIYLGKNSPENNQDLEFTGISKFSAAFLKEMLKMHEFNLSRGRNKGYYEDCAYQVSRVLPWHGLISDLAWSEIDDPNHLQFVLKNILPAIPRN